MLCMLVMHALPAYNACMQYTIRNIPPEVDKALRAKAKAEGESLNETLVGALGEALGVSGTQIKRRDLSDIAGTWVDDPVFDEVRELHERIDPEIWK